MLIELCGQSGPAIEDRVRQAWKIALGREPSPQEMETASALVTPGGRADKIVDGRQHYTRLAITLFNLNEFVYID